MGLKQRLYYFYPPQFLFVGDNFLDIFTIARGRVTAQKRLAAVNLSQISAETSTLLQGELARVDTGVLLHPDCFIYNILEFERLPLKKSLRLELILWRLQKEFPENMEAYQHVFFRLDRKRVLALLLRKKIMAGLETLFAEQGIPLTFLGNSTIEIMNRLFRQKNCPDFFIEYEAPNAMMVFQKQGIPIYQRKIKAESTAELIQELHRTLEYSSGQYALQPQQYALIGHGKIDLAAEIEQGLALDKPAKKVTVYHTYNFLPGAR